LLFFLTVDIDVQEHGKLWLETGWLGHFHPVEAQLAHYAPIRNWGQAFLIKRIKICIGQNLICGMKHLGVYVFFIFYLFNVLTPETTMGQRKHLTQSEVQSLLVCARQGAILNGITV